MNTFESAPVPPELAQGISTHEQHQMAGLSRRRFIMGAALAVGAVALPIEVAGTIYAIDETVNDLIYPGTKSKIVTLAHEDVTARDLSYIYSGTLELAGLGQRPETARRMAEKLGKAPYKNDRMSYVEYASQGVRIDDLTDEFEDFESSVGYLDLFCNSMGSITFANIMGEKRRRLVAEQPGATSVVDRPTRGRHAPKPIRTLTFCGSPFDVEDTYQATAVKAISGYALSGTMTEKFITKLALATSANPRYAGLKEMLEVAGRDTFDKLPPKMWASQIAQLGTTSIASFMRSYEGAITPQTQIIYLRPKDPAGDRVVRVEQASARIGQFFTTNFGARFKSVEMTGAGHADIDRACECAEFRDLLEGNSGYPI
jgi:hypothetical protein